MTIKEAILKSLEDLKVPVYNNEVLNHIIEKDYYKFTKGKNTWSNYFGTTWRFYKKW